MKIGILECGKLAAHIEQAHGSYPALYSKLLAGHDFTFDSFDVMNMAFPKSVNDCDGWLLTGSHHGAYEDVPFIEPLKTFIRKAYSADVPIVGICFGHQILAQALGGRVEKFSGGWALGLNQYEFKGLGALQLNAWHQDQIVELPPEARVVASTPFCANAALAYKGRAISIQPHPEFDGGVIEALVDLRRGTNDYPDDLMDIAAKNAPLADHNAKIGSHIADFFKNSQEATNV